MTKIRKYITMLLIVCIFTNQAVAVASGWMLQGAAYEAGSIALSATKNGVSKLLRVKPSPKVVGKALGKRLAPIAVAGAMAGIVGKGVDYVMDPANNRVQYAIEPTDGCPPTMPNNPDYKFERSNKGTENRNGVSVPYIGCSYKNASGFTDAFKIYGSVGSIPLENVAQQVISDAANGDQISKNALEDVAADLANAGVLDNEFVEANPNRVIDIDIDDVGDYASNVGANGADGADAPPVDLSPIMSAISSMQGVLVGAISDVKSGIADLIGSQTEDIISGQQSQTDSITDAIDASTTATGEVIGQQTQDIISGQQSQTDSITDAIDASTTATGEVIGQQTQDIISGQQSQTDSITDAISDQTDAVNDKFDEFAEELPEEITELDIPDPPLPDTNTKVTFSGQCPTDKKVTFDYHGNNIEWVVMPWSSMCQTLTDYIAPVLKLLGALFAVVIVGRS